MTRDVTRKLLLLAGAILIFSSANLHAQAVDVGNTVANQFAAAIKGFGAQIEPYAESLFWYLASISLVWTGVTLALKKADIMDFLAEFTRFIMATGFFYWLLKNSTEMSIAIITSLQQAGSNVGGGNAGQSNTIMQLAMSFANAATNNISILSPNMAVLWALMALIILLIGCYVVVTTTIALCSALLLVYAGIFVLGFGGARWTSEIAIGYYKAVVAAGLRLFTLNLLVKTAVSLVNSAATTDLTNINNAFTLLALMVIVAMLIDKVPSQIASLVSHNHVGAHGSALGTLTGAASIAAQGAAAVATSGGSLAVSGGNAVKNAAMRAVAAMRK